MRANGQTEDKLGHARACSEQGHKIGTGPVRLAQTGKRMTAASVETEPPGQVVNALFRARAKNEDRCGQLVGNDGRNVVNGLRVQADG